MKTAQCSIVLLNAKECDATDVDSSNAAGTQNKKPSAAPRVLNIKRMKNYASVSAGASGVVPFSCCCNFSLIWASAPKSPKVGFSTLP